MNINLKKKWNIHNIKRNDHPAFFSFFHFLVGGALSPIVTEMIHIDQSIKSAT